MPDRNSDELPLITNSQLDIVNDKIIIWDDSASGIDRTKAAVIEEAKRIFSPGQYLNNNTGSTIAKCSAVYLSSTNNISLANANSNSTYNIIGLTQYSIDNTTNGFIQSGGILTATTGEWDAVTGGSGGLTAGSIYYLSPTTAGRIITTAPSTLGHRLVEVGTALNTTDLLIRIIHRGVVRTATFTSGDLSSNVLTLNHNVGQRYFPLVVADSTGKAVIPKDINYTTADQFQIDFGSATVSGTWSIGF